MHNTVDEGLCVSSSKPGIEYDPRRRAPPNKPRQGGHGALVHSDRFGDAIEVRVSFPLCQVPLYLDIRAGWAAWGGTRTSRLKLRGRRAHRPDWCAFVFIFSEIRPTPLACTVPPAACHLAIRVLKTVCTAGGQRISVSSTLLGVTGLLGGRVCARSERAAFTRFPIARKTARACGLPNARSTRMWAELGVSRTRTLRLIAD